MLLTFCPIVMEITSEVVNSCRAIWNA